MICKILPPLKCVRGLDFVNKNQRQQDKINSVDLTTRIDNRVVKQSTCALIWRSC